MKQLLAAIKIKYNLADGAGQPFTVLRAANTGGLYTEQHLREQAMPYVTLHIVSGSSTYTMGKDEIATSTVLFSIYDDALATVIDIYDKLTDAFDDCGLVYSTDTALVMERVSETGPVKEAEFWQVDVDYRVMRHSSLTPETYSQLYMNNLLPVWA